MDQSNNEAGEIETSMNEVAAEEPPVAEGLFSSFTKIFSSTTESNPPGSEEEGQTILDSIQLFISSALSSLRFWGIFSYFQHRPRCY